MALDLKAWLTEIGVAADKIDAILPALGDTVAANIEKSTLRQSDYSTKMNALGVAQTKLDEANERLNLEMVEWSETQQAGGVITEKMRKDLAKAQGEVARLTSVITTKSTELGLNPAEIIGDVPPVVVPPTPAGPDLSGYAKFTDLDTRFGNVGDYLMQLPVEIAVIQHEHQELTGEWLDPREIIKEVKARATDKLNRNADGSFKKPVDPRSIWEETNGIAAKRTTRQTEAHTAEIKAAEERGYERRATEAALPGQQPIGRHSPVLRQAGNAQDGGSKAPRPGQAGHASRLSGAATALATHKYRPGGQSAGGGH